MAATPRRRTQAANLVAPAFRLAWAGLAGLAEERQLWAVYIKDPNRDTLDQLVRFYLPFAFMNATRLHRGLRDRSAVPPAFDDVLSDCCMGLLNAVDRYHPREGGVRFVSFSAACMRRSVFRGLYEREDWSYQRRTTDKVVARRMVIRSFRRGFVREHGRQPEKEDLRAYLASVVINPGIQIGEVPTMLNFSHESLKQELGRLRAGDHALPALYPTRALRAAMHGLDAADRRLLKAILRGESSAAVGQMLGLNSRLAKKRMNGLVWELQRRVELAAALGVEPIIKPMPKNAGRPVHPRRCGHCETSFTPGKHARNAEFCSPECRRRQQAKRLAS